jgi:putative membrane protein
VCWYPATYGGNPWQMETTGRPTLAITLILALAAGACQGRTGNAGGTETAARDTTTSAPQTTATPATAPKGGLSDETILGMLDGASKIDSFAGTLASKKATDPEVKAYASMMMKDHHELRVSGEELAKKLGVTPKPPEKDPIAGYANAEIAALQKAKKGEDFDKTYIDNEVSVHQAVLDAANMARVSTSTAELKELIQNAIPIFQGHLAQAQAIQKRLSPTT